MTSFFRHCGRVLSSVGNYTTKDTNARHGGLFHALKVLLACARIPRRWISAYLCKKTDEKIWQYLKS